MSLIDKFGTMLWRGFTRLVILSVMLYVMIVFGG